MTFGENFNQKPGQRDMASRPSKFDFWSRIQSEPGQRDMASRTSKFDFWRHAFNQSLDNVTWPAGLQRLTFGGYFNQSLDQRDMASKPSKLDFW